MKGLRRAGALSREKVEALSGRVPEEFWVSFWDKIEAEGDTGDCWLWTAGKNRFGYGVVKIGPKPARKNLLAHRIAYVYFGNEFSEGDDGIHSCDQPSCCNPDHIRPGNQVENNRDMWSRGRGVPPPGNKALQEKRAEDLLAFRVSNADFPELGTEIVFAATDEDAAAIRHCGDSVAVEVSREPAFDQYAPGPIPVRALLESGWSLSAEELEAGGVRLTGSRAAAFFGLEAA